MSTLQTRGASGRKLNVTAPTGGLASNTIYAIREGVTGWCGIVTNTVAVGETAVIEYGHQVEVPKNTGTGESFALGALVYVDDSTGKATASATGNHLMGAATEAAGTAATTVWVQLKIA